MINLNSFHAKSPFEVGNQSFTIFSLRKLDKADVLARLPFSLKILLENLLRHEDGKNVRREDIDALLQWNPKAAPEKEISFMPARVLLQDFTGVPCAVDLAAMRDAMVSMGGDPKNINPLQPVDLVIDHSVQVDEFGTPTAFLANAEKEFERNKERYAFLRWAQQAFRNFRVVPPDTGIVHQVNLEYLAQGVFTSRHADALYAYPDTLVGTDSHTTMINGLGVLGWGVGGIEAEAAMLGQPISMLIPHVVGVKLSGTLLAGATATDLVLTVTQLLRKKGVVGKFVEFFGAGLSALTLADRATIANMAPEYGATMGYFPVDAETLNYLLFSGRKADHVALVEAYCREQGLFYSSDSKDASYSDMLDLDLATIQPSIAGPKRPQDRVNLTDAKVSFRSSLLEMLQVKGVTIDSKTASSYISEAKSSDPGSLTFLKKIAVRKNGSSFDLTHGSVVIAAITSCTNTSNPSVMLAAGLVAKRAVERGLRVKPWVKTSLAPGSKVVTDYLRQANLTKPLEQLGFHLVGYGCTTCIGNSGPLPEAIANAIQEHDLVAVAVLSGNRNFEGRINSHVRANYLASPPLVVVYALAGTMDIDLEHEPIGRDQTGAPVYLRDVWPTPTEVESMIRSCVTTEMFRKQYSDVFDGDKRWQSLAVPKGDQYMWAGTSTYIKAPPFFDNLGKMPEPLKDIRGARVLALLGDSVTTDHISPAGSINPKSPAAQYLMSQGVEPKNFNSYGSRRGNHEVMVRGTFANIRLRNLLAPGTEGGWTRYISASEPEAVPGALANQPMTIYDASVKYRQAGVPLIIIAGKEYGAGSSRDWAAKGPRLLGVRAVIAESYERIHRSNLIGMGVIPLQLVESQNWKSLGLTGFESFDIIGIAENLRPGKMIRVSATNGEGRQISFSVLCRIDTPMELDYYRNDGILQYVLRSLLDR